MRLTSDASRGPRLTVFELAGGLGNQLFQYAAGVYYAAATGNPVVFDTSVIDRRQNTQGRITDSLDLVGDFKNYGNGWLKTRRLLAKIAAQLSLRIPNGGSNTFLERIAYISKAVGFDAALQNLPAGTFVRGYFQTHAYVEQLQHQGLWPKLELREPSEWFQELEHEIQITRPGSLHLRRGDYVGLGDKYGLLSPAYYRDAIQSIPGAERPRKWLIFSDDAAEAAKLADECQDLIKSEVVVPPEGTDPTESLVLMSLCSANIIANSTFSYWAALLNEKSSTTIGPKPWYRNMQDPEGLIPDAWGRIQSVWL